MHFNLCVIKTAFVVSRTDENLIKATLYYLYLNESVKLI